MNDAPEHVFLTNPGTAEEFGRLISDPKGVGLLFEYVRADIHREAVMQQLATAGQAQDALAELAAVRELAEKLADAIRDMRHTASDEGTAALAAWEAAQ